MYYSTIKSMFCKVLFWKKDTFFVIDCFSKYILTTQEIYCIMDAAYFVTFYFGISNFGIDWNMTVRLGGKTNERNVPVK